MHPKVVVRMVMNSALRTMEILLDRGENARPYRVEMVFLSAHGGLTQWLIVANSV